jgi:hypothetical protein
MRYWVVGGEYRDTSFTSFAPGAREERYGPYASYREAYAAWSARARATIDDATIRYRIRADEEGAG